MNWSLSRFLPLRFQKVCANRIIDLGAMVDLPPGFHPSNPSIINVGEDYFVCVRGVNYILTDNYECHFTAGETWTTVNRFLLLGPDLRVKKRFPHLDDLAFQVEDIKLFEFEGAICGAGSCNTEDGNAILLVRFDKDFTSLEIEQLASPFQSKREKNWSPFVHDNKIKFIYTYDPLIILEYDAGKVTVSYPSDVSTPNGPIRLSGSSSGMYVGNSLLFVAHRRKIDVPDVRKRLYVNKLFKIDVDGEHARVESGPYFVTEARLQYINGIAGSADQMFLSYGKMDTQAFLACFDRKTFFRELLPA